MNAKQAKLLRRAVRMQARLNGSLVERDHIDLAKVTQRVSQRPAPSRIVVLPNTQRGIYRLLKRDLQNKNGSA